MKTFKDLIFTEHPVKPYFKTQSVINFDNLYGISVINGYSAHCGTDTFEVAILYNGEITYHTDITDDVLTYQTPDDITSLMKKLQQL